MSGGLVMFGAFADGVISARAIIAALISGVLIALGHFKTFWDKQKI